MSMVYTKIPIRSSLIKVNKKARQNEEQKSKRAKEQKSKIASKK